jgi:hypothetical protein
LVTRIQHSVTYGGSYLTTMELAKDTLFSRLARTLGAGGEGTVARELDITEENQEILDQIDSGINVENVA